MKRAQISVVIIIGLVLMILTGTGLYLLYAGERAPRLQPVDLTIARQVLQDCLEDVAMGEAFAIAAQGGRRVPLRTIEVNGTAFAVGVAENKLLLPDIDQVADELAAGVAADTYACTIDKLAQQGLSASYGNATATATLTTETSTILLNWPVSVTAGDSTTTLTDWRIKTIPLIPAYPDALLVADNFIETQNIDIAFNSGRDSDIVAIPLNDTAVIYISQDDRSQLGGVPLAVAFVALTSANQAPRILMPATMPTPYSGTLFSINIDTNDDRDTEGSGLTYSVDSPLFTITSTGQLSFEADPAGTYSAVITVTDSEGASDSTPLTIEVLP